jgi:hypothetical protein|uniref:Uncharacterized protein n=1 Tax=viral metagenome TaxID=1070528 RepID=A0A6C0C4U3_9ZZZZ
MGSVMSKFCACIFCCCPDKNCQDCEKQRVEIIYNQVRDLDECFDTNEFI